MNYKPTDTIICAACNCAVTLQDCQHYPAAPAAKSNWGGSRKRNASSVSVSELQDDPELYDFDS